MSYLKSNTASDLHDNVIIYGRSQIRYFASLCYVSSGFLTKLSTIVICFHFINICPGWPQNAVLQGHITFTNAPECCSTALLAQSQHHN